MNGSIQPRVLDEIYPNLKAGFYTPRIFLFEYAKVAVY